MSGIFSSLAAGDAARKRSAEVRGARAVRKREVDGALARMRSEGLLAAMPAVDAREFAARIVEDPVGVLRPMRIMDVLCAIPQVGPATTARYLWRARVRAGRVTVGSLSVRERMALAALLRVPRRDLSGEGRNA